MLVEIITCGSSCDEAFIERKFGRKSFEYLRRNPYMGANDPRLDVEQFTRRFVNPLYITDITECNGCASLPVADGKGGFKQVNGRPEYKVVGTFKSYLIKLIDAQFNMLDEDFDRVKGLLGIATANMTDAATHEREEKARREAEDQAAISRTIAAINGSCT